MADEWNVAVPDDHSLISAYPAHDRALRTNAKAVIENEHEDLGDSNTGGEHSSGAAVGYEGTDEPTERPGGTSLADNAIDRGRLWLDDNYDPPILKRWDGSAWEIVALQESNIEAMTDADTLTAAELLGSKLFTNDGADAMVTLTLPAGAAGMKASFLVTDAQYLKVLTAGTEKIRYGGTQTAGPGYVRSNVVGTLWTLVFSADDWVITNLMGAVNYDQ